MGHSASYTATVYVMRGEENKAPKNDLYLDLNKDVYFESDNSSYEEFKITQKFIDSLKPGDRIVLSADGCDASCGYGSDEEE